MPSDLPTPKVLWSTSPITRKEKKASSPNNDKKRKPRKAKLSPQSNIFKYLSPRSTGQKSNVRVGTGKENNINDASMPQMFIPAKRKLNMTQEIDDDAKNVCLSLASDRSLKRKSNPSKLQKLSTLSFSASHNFIDSHHRKGLSYVGLRREYLAQSISGDFFPILNVGQFLGRRSSVMVSPADIVLSETKDNKRPRRVLKLGVGSDSDGVSRKHIQILSIHPAAGDAYVKIQCNCHNGIAFLKGSALSLSRQKSLIATMHGKNKHSKLIKHLKLGGQATLYVGDMLVLDTYRTKHLRNGRDATAPKHIFTLQTLPTVDIFVKSDVDDVKPVKSTKRETSDAPISRTNLSDHFQSSSEHELQEEGSDQLDDDPDYFSQEATMRASEPTIVPNRPQRKRVQIRRYIEEFSQPDVIDLWETEDDFKHSQKVPITKKEKDLSPIYETQGAGTETIDLCERSDQEEVPAVAKPVHLEVASKEDPGAAVKNEDVVPTRAPGIIFPSSSASPKDEDAPLFCDEPNHQKSPEIQRPTEEESIAKSLPELSVMPLQLSRRIMEVLESQVTDVGVEWLQQWASPQFRYVPDRRLWTYIFRLLLCGPWSSDSVYAYASFEDPLQMRIVLGYVLSLWKRYPHLELPDNQTDTEQALEQFLNTVVDDNESAAKHYVHSFDTIQQHICSLEFLLALVTRQGFPTPARQVDNLSRKLAKFAASCLFNGEPSEEIDPSEVSDGCSSAIAVRRRLLGEVLEKLNASMVSNSSTKRIPFKPADFAAIVKKAVDEETSTAVSGATKEQQRLLLSFILDFTPDCPLQKALAQEWKLTKKLKIILS
jgi:hypothetical protein